MKIIQLTNGLHSIVDDEDFQYLSRWRWHALVSKGHAYAARSERGRLITMHQSILRTEGGQEVDHKNGDGLDNRRENLRPCSHTQNMQNRPRQRNNSTGFKGVLYRKDRGRWQAQIRFKGRKIVRQCESREAAAREYDVLATSLFGEFAHLNFPTV